MKFTCIIVVFQIMIVTMACSNTASKKFDNAAFGKVNEDGKTPTVNFRSFQNADKTWGFTIIINNVPFRNYNTIPYKKALTGFTTQKEAEEVADIFVRQIRKGILSPELTRTMIDSLKIKTNSDM